MEGLTITRHGSASAGEYHAHVEGSDKIGRLTWVQKDNVRAAEHTLVPPELGGRGIAARLVDALVADAREHGFKVKPVCSYVVKAFEKHPEWAELKA
ncbi:GNAT family N-acetyltransferase [Novosphingobium sp. TH158]|uniref:GNAT family N-acetyltransferase n=1 Tax=Novosphingobium sp. TH158 TaxID=2067455 RepID=UPI000C7B6BD2|nr:GNAT family N-acetyltransferase [Novosphingobium sp. TH158]PLK27045.1 N-acetyltransferase [Novosphingobium sp. TH158]